MSGSSLDGIDLAICSFANDKTFHIHKAATLPIPEKIVNDIVHFVDLDPFQLAKLDADFSNYTSEVINDFIADYPKAIDLIVNHGHTIYHAPDKNISWQLGNGGIIASKCRINTLCDLRIQDVSLGGQGAPLASLMDKYILNDYNLLINLGGIANVSLRKENDIIISWDVGPCNQVLNALAKRLGKDFDDQGEIARGGKVIKNLISSWQTIDYFSMDAPKSLDNFWVQTNFTDPILNLDYNVKDLMCTTVEFLALQLSADIQKCHGSDLNGLVTGGGAYNKFLMERINACLSGNNITVLPADSELIEYKEAVLMAYMGYRYLIGNPNTVASATGALENIRAGALYLGNG
jgi:anhydro-N-acetylmuramic acid kinase